MKRVLTLLLATAICFTACQTPVLDIQYRGAPSAQDYNAWDGGAEVPTAREDDFARWVAIVLDAGPTDTDSAVESPTGAVEEIGHGDASSSDAGSNAPN